MLTDRATWAAAGVAALTAVAAYALPLKLNIVVAIAAAVVAGLLVDQPQHPVGSHRRRPHMTTNITLTWPVALALVGLGLVTLLTRGFFLLPQREWPLPDWLRKGLRYAPLAALTAVVAPEVVLTQGQLIDSVKDARLYAATAGALWFFLRRDILGTIVAGMIVFLPLRLILGW